ncbi:hypothetical protein AUJ46_04440 [Candidatus Peregrinibacteria bacterium CG1_02_54_53]|nr:MAG: hypothetical protein AUJ46_04440 [Candidatus Peregrinibacteria bacterium CG1_02_54_53]
MSTKKKADAKFTFIDLFAGIGGFHLAFHRLGGKCVYASEWNEQARKTYEANFRPIDPELFENDLFTGDITLKKIKKRYPTALTFFVPDFPVNLSAKRDSSVDSKKPEEPCFSRS